MSLSLLMVMIEKYVRNEPADATTPLETENQPTSDTAHMDSSESISVDVVHDTPNEAIHEAQNNDQPLDEKKSGEMTEAELLKHWFFD